METHDDHVDLLYLRDSETFLQTIHKWIGCGDKLNLSKSPDTDVLKDIVLKLQKRVESGSGTQLIKVKAHRGDPLKEESDIRSELVRLKEYKETIWDDSTVIELYTNGVEDQPIPKTSTPSLIRSLESGLPDKFRRRIDGHKEENNK